MYNILQSYSITEAQNRVISGKDVWCVDETDALVLCALLGGPSREKERGHGNAKNNAWHYHAAGASQSHIFFGVVNINFIAFLW